MPKILVNELCKIKKPDKSYYNFLEFVLFALEFDIEDERKDFQIHCTSKIVCYKIILNVILFYFFSKKSKLY